MVKGEGIEGRPAAAAVGVPTLVSLMAFAASVPFLLPNLDILHRALIPTEGGPIALVTVGDGLSFLRVSALAALFTALGMLFICLLKTAYGRLTWRFVCLGAISFVIGTVTAAGIMPFADVPVAVMRGAAVLMGFGVSVLGMAWFVQLEFSDFRTMLRMLVLLLSAVAAIDLVLMVLPVPWSAAARMVLASVGAAGCIAGFRKMHAGDLTVPGSNWWDVFGRLDVSIIDDAHDFASLANRVIFFVITPAVILLLLVMAMDLHHNALQDDFPIEAIGTLVAVALAVPLLVIKTDRITMQAAYRLYLPLIGAAVFIGGNFMPSDFHSVFMDTGIFVFCSLYGILLSALAMTMASRMPSLRLPTACLMVLAAGIIAIVSYARVDAGSLGWMRLTVLMALQVAAIVLLAAVPTARIWSLASADPDLLEPSSDSAGHPTLEDRCDSVARRYGLTPRESQVLRYLGRGHGSAYIAGELVVAESTVRSHVKSIYRKTGVNSRESLLECIDHEGAMLSEKK
jgi:DNA-binding CsgD family transcriptional regulator